LLPFSTPVCNTLSQWLRWRAMEPNRSLYNAVVR
jgi:hypothetical protein